MRLFGHRWRKAIESLGQRAAEAPSSAEVQAEAQEQEKPKEQEPQQEAQEIVAPERVEEVPEASPVEGEDEKEAAEGAGEAEPIASAREELRETPVAELISFGLLTAGQAAALANLGIATWGDLANLNSEKAESNIDVMVDGVTLADLSWQAWDRLGRQAQYVEQKREDGAARSQRQEGKEKFLQELELGLDDAGVRYVEAKLEMETLRGRLGDRFATKAGMEREEKVREAWGVYRQKLEAWIDNSAENVGEAVEMAAKAEEALVRAELEAKTSTWFGEKAAEAHKLLDSLREASVLNALQKRGKWTPKNTAGRALLQMANLRTVASVGLALGSATVATVSLPLGFGVLGLRAAILSTGTYDLVWGNWMRKKYESLSEKEEGEFFSDPEPKEGERSWMRQMQSDKIERTLGRMEASAFLANKDVRTIQDYRRLSDRYWELVRRDVQGIQDAQGGGPMPVGKVLGQYLGFKEHKRAGERRWAKSTRIGVRGVATVVGIAMSGAWEMLEAGQGTTAAVSVGEGAAQGTGASAAEGAAGAAAGESGGVIEGASSGVVPLKETLAEHVQAAEAAAGEPGAAAARFAESLAVHDPAMTAVVEDGSSFWEAGRSLVERGTMTDKEFAEMWSSPASVWTLSDGTQEHISNLGFVRPGVMVEAVKASGDVPAHFAIVDALGEGTHIGNNHMLLEAVMREGKAVPQWLRDATGGGAVDAVEEAAAGAADTVAEAAFWEMAGATESAKDILGSLPAEVDMTEAAAEFSRESLAGQEEAITELTQQRGLLGRFLDSLTGTPDADAMAPAVENAQSGISSAIDTLEGSEAYQQNLEVLNTFVADDLDIGRRAYESMADASVGALAVGSPDTLMALQVKGVDAEDIETMRTLLRQFHPFGVQEWHWNVDRFLKSLVVNGKMALPSKVL